MQRRFFSSLVLGVAMSLVSTQAFAQDSTGGGHSTENGSEFLWQTPAGKFELTPAIDFSKATTKYKSEFSTTDKRESDGMDASVLFGYGIDEMFAVDARLAYENTKFETSPSAGGDNSFTSKGLADIEFNFRGRIPLSNGSLRFGTELSVSPGDREEEEDGDENAMSGGHALTPFVGYEMALMSGTAGARLSYEIELGDKTYKIKDEDGEINAKLSGGNATTFDLFYETALNPTVMLGGALTLSGTSRSKVKVDDASDNVSGATIAGLKVYVPVFLPSVTLLPELGYAQGIAMNHTMDSYEAWDLSLGARFAF